MLAGASFGNVRASAALYEPLRRLPQITRMSRFPSAMFPPISMPRRGLIMERGKSQEKGQTPKFVMPGLVPGIHVLWRFKQVRRGWPGQGPAMTEEGSTRAPVAVDERRERLELLLDEAA